MITVFYDGKCDICLREINYYRKVAPQGVFIWCDVTKSHEDLARQGISLSEGLMYFHAQDTDGKMHVGVDAFILIWRQLKYWRILATIVSLPTIHKIAEFIYKRFAIWRFKRLDHCQIAEKKDKAK